MHRRDGFAPEVIDGDRIDESCDGRPVQGDATLAQDPADDGRVAVRVPNERARAVVEEEQCCARRVDRPQQIAREVRPLEMLRPRHLRGEQTRMHRLEPGGDIGGGVAGRHDHEVTSLSTSALPSANDPWR